MPDENPIVFSPETFARHDQAVAYVDSLSRTRNPVDQQDRYPDIIPATWGLLAPGDAITAASGLTLGSGPVKLCDRTGTVADDAETLTVANAGGSIDGGASGMILPMEWVDGEWTVCVCGGGETPCEGSCPACGGVMLMGGGTFADANGSGSIVLSSGQWLTSSSPGTFSPLLFPGQPHLANPTVDCGTETIDIPYHYLFECLDDGSVRLTLFMSWVECSSDSSIVTWDTAGRSAVASSAVSPSCGGGSLAATFTFPPTLSLGVFGILPTPSTSVSLSIPFATTADYECCSPCPIPKHDLTLSYTSIFVPGVWGSTTLYYKPGGVSLDEACVECGEVDACLIYRGPGWYSQVPPDMPIGLSCQGGSIVLEWIYSYDLDGVGHCAHVSTALRDSTCSPFHLEFHIDGGTGFSFGDTAYVDYP